MFKLFSKEKKYTIRYSYNFNNTPYNDTVYFLGKPNSLAIKDYERIKIWTKEGNLNKLKEKPYLIKQDILESCCFESQRCELDMILK